MEQNQKEQCAEELLHWIKKLSWEENNERTDATLKFEINPFVGKDSADSKFKKCLCAMTLDEIKSIVEYLACERIDVFRVNSLMFTYVGDLEEGVIKVEAGVHLSE